MALTSEYQYIGRSNAVKDQNSKYSYYILLYAKTAADMATGRHTVSVKMLLASEMNTFYGYATSGGISINGVSATSWSWAANAPGTAWNHSNLTAGGVTYKAAVDLREVSLAVDVGYGAAKDIPIAASWTFNSGTAGYMPQVSATASVSVSVTLPMIAGASTPTVSSGSVAMGSKLTIYTNRIAGSGLTHTISYKFGNASGTIGTGVGDSVEWTPSLELARQIPNAVSGTAVIRCTTYAGGTEIGTKEVTAVLTVPASVVPTASAAWEDTSGAYGMMGTLVQGVSKLDVTVSGTGSYGSTPVSSRVALQGKAYNGGVITESGSLRLAVAVTDSRGRAGGTAYTLSVAAYTPPSMTLSASRCLSDGTADEAGDHAKIAMSGFVTQVNGKNRSELTVQWGSQSETVSLGTGNVSWQKIVAADVNNTMAISAVLGDRLVNVSRSMTLSTGYATLDFLAGGKGIAFGKAATKEGFECAMPAYFPGGYDGIARPGVLSFGNDTDESRLNGALDGLVDTMNNRNLMQLLFVDSPALNSMEFFGTLYRHNANYCVLTGWSYSGEIVRKVKYNGVWRPFEYLNPTMVLGVEYRTTERWRGKTVYTKLVDFGAMPNKTVSNVQIDSSALNVIAVEGIAYTATETNRFPVYFSGSLAAYSYSLVYNGSTRIYINALADTSDYNATFIIKYTKD